MSHYFDSKQNTKSIESKFTLKYKDNLFVFITDKGIFSKNYIDFGTKCLLDVVSNEKLYGNVLDLGSGYGPICIILKKLFSNLNLFGIEVNNRAYNLSKKNALLNNVNINLFNLDAIKLDNILFDFIVFNPPIKSGKKNIYDLYNQSFSYLKENGALYIVIKKQHGALSTIKELEKNNFFVNILDKVNGYFIIKAIKTKGA